MSTGLNGHRPPPSDCSRYAEALAGLRAGLLSSAEREDLRRHVATCAACQARRSSADEAALDAAVRRHYGVPAGRAPFLRLEDVLARSAADAEDEPPVIPTIRSTREILFMSTDAPDTFGHATTTISSQAPRGPGRGKVAAAVAAVAAIAALFALILHAAAPGSSVADKGSPTATPRALHYLGANGKWEISTVEESKQNGPVIVVAPSDPHVMYKPSIDGTPTMQRSDDGGKTWIALSLPRGDVGNTSAYLMLSVSPLDAKTVFAIVSSDASNPNCPRPAYQAYSPNGAHIGALAVLRPQSGGYNCTFEYVSTDGGATWQKPQTPEKGDVGEGQPAFQAQDGRLYSLLYPDINGPADQGHRLLRSTDGVHWQPADAQLFAQGQHVYEFAATPTGTTLFATTIPVNTFGGDATAHRQFWRSDDAGASWRNLGTFPNTRSDSQDSWLSAAALVDGKALVYYTTAQPLPSQGSDPNPTPGPEVPGLPSSTGVPMIHVSADNGHSWHISPQTGLPAGQSAASTAPVGILPDGTLVEQFVTVANVSTVPNLLQTHFTDLSFYGWKPGAASWTQLTPVIHGAVGFNRSTWLDQPTGARPAGIWTTVDDGNAVKLEYCRLTA